MNNIFNLSEEEKQMENELENYTSVRRNEKNCIDKRIHYTTPTPK
jgi:hypothetical protein